ncbi:unnamed protein product, partial [Bubo scandiacus]
AVGCPLPGEQTLPQEAASPLGATPGLWQRMPKMPMGEEMNGHSHAPSQLPREKRQQQLRDGRKGEAAGGTGEHGTASITGPAWLARWRPLCGAPGESPQRATAGPALSPTGSGSVSAVACTAEQWPGASRAAQTSELFRPGHE